MVRIIEDCDKIISHRSCTHKPAKSNRDCAWSNKKCWLKSNAPVAKANVPFRLKSSCKDLTSRNGCVRPGVPGRNCMWSDNTCSTSNPSLTTMGLPKSFLEKKIVKSPSPIRRKQVSPKIKQRQRTPSKGKQQHDVSSN